MIVSRVLKIVDHVQDRVVVKSRIVNTVHRTLSVTASCPTCRYNKITVCKHFYFEINH